MSIPFIMRKSSLFILFIFANIFIIVALLLHASHLNAKGETSRKYRLKLVQDLRLTDLCLFTEARYTRHLSMADLHSAFQDHPVAMEHFPSGSFTRPRP